MPSRLAQITVTGKRRRFSSSSSGRRSARRAMFATFTTEPGLRTRLGSASSRMTGSTRVAWRIGQTSDGEVEAPVPQRPLGDRRQHLAPLPGRAADRVHEHEGADDVGVVVGEPDRHAATEGVADDDHLLLHADGPEELLEPGRVAREVEVLSGQPRRAAEAGQRRCEDLAALLGEAVEHGLVGVLPERPTVGEHHRHALADHAVLRRAVLHPRPLPDDRTPGGAFGHRLGLRADEGVRRRRRRPAGRRAARCAGRRGWAPLSGWSVAVAVGRPIGGSVGRRGQAVADASSRRARRSISFRPPQIPWGSRIVSA